MFFVTLRRFAFIWLSCDLVEYNKVMERGRNLTEKFREEIIINK